MEFELENPDADELLEFLESAESQEGLDDLDEISAKIVSQAVVSANDWTTETILAQINKGNILLNPRFQRRDAWDRKRKSRFIESLFLGLPIPQLVLAENKKKKGSYIVIDGKQRLLSIRQFGSKENDPEYQQLSLVGLKIRNDLNRKSYEQLKIDSEFQEDLATFENQSIRTVIIKNWPNESFLYHVFLRLNTGSVPLSPQELRQALHPGPFIDYVDSTSINSKALRVILNNRKPDFRMRDVELLIRYIGFSMYLSRYKGNLKAFLDEIVKVMNETFEQQGQFVSNLVDQFEMSHDFATSIFGLKNVYKKWTVDTYESKFNRAIFDCIHFFFSKPELRGRLKNKLVEVEVAFKDLCQNDPKFVGALEKTTKSLESTSYRLAKWGDRLEQISGLKLARPVLKSNQISIY